MSTSKHANEPPRSATRAERARLFSNFTLVMDAQPISFASRYLAWKSAQRDRRKSAIIYACLAGLLILAGCAGNLGPYPQWVWTEEG